MVVGRAMAVTHTRSGGGRFAPLRPGRARKPAAAGPRPLTSPAITPPAPHLRLATAADLPAIVDIYNATIPERTATAQLEPVTIEERRPWFEASTPDRRPLWVAESSGEVVAWVGLSDFHERAAYSATAQVSIYLRADQRGQGLGGRMLEHALEGSRAIGVTHLIGLVFAHNSASLKLFERHGFERWGFMPEVANMDGVLRDLVHVGRRV
jgi:L-amino acid N-acyltransferase YncA